MAIERVSQPDQGGERTRDVAIEEAGEVVGFANIPVDQ